MVYDSVGCATFDGGLECAKLRGYFIGYGNASGNFADIDPLRLMRFGSGYFQRTTMYDFIRTREDLEMMGGELMSLVRNGSIDIEVSRPALSYPILCRTPASPYGSAGPEDVGVCYL